MSSDRVRIAVLSLALLSTIAPAGARAAGPDAKEVMSQDGSVQVRGCASGIDVLEARRFEPLIGKRIGLITNQTGVDRDRRSTADVLAAAPGVKLVALFSPEHGIRGVLDSEVEHGKDERTGLPIFSLYGTTRRPTDRMLAGLDALVFDIQDIGTRFYTYITTLGYCMEAAARRRIPIYVLDRPNPLGGVRVEGPVMDKALTSFTGYHPMPTRHGMTAGELARMFNDERGIGCDLQVIPVRGWQRGMYQEDTGLPWVNTSPNIRSPVEALLYAGIGALESTNVSVGRGTSHPFEVVGAPWIKGAPLAGYLQERHLPGIRFRAVGFTPDASVYKGKRCEGVFLEVTDRAAFDSVRCGLEVASALHRLHGATFEAKSFGGMIGQRWVVDRIRAGVDPEAIQQEWEPGRQTFLERRARYLLYPGRSGGGEGAGE